MRKPQGRAGIAAAEVTALVSEIHSGAFNVYYGAVIGEFEVKPWQALSEIHNAITHCGRALQATTEADAQKQIDLARSHYDRALRDCLKIYVNKKTRKLNDMIARIEYHYGLLHHPINVSFKNAKKTRKDIFAAETQGAPRATFQLQELAKVLYEIEEQIEEKYDSIPADSDVLGVRLKRALLPGFIGLALGVASSLVASYIWSLLQK